MVRTRRITQTPKKAPDQKAIQAQLDEADRTRAASSLRRPERPTGQPRSRSIASLPAADWSARLRRFHGYRGHAPPLRARSRPSHAAEPVSGTRRTSSTPNAPAASLALIVREATTRSAHRASIRLACGFFDHSFDEKMPHRLFHNPQRIQRNLHVRQVNAKDFRSRSRDCRSDSFTESLSCRRCL
jgi:hypothetical protein